MKQPKKLLRINWSKREKDLIFHSPSAPDGHLMHAFTHYVLFDGKTLRQALEERGYDIATLKFSVERKPKVESL
jgi:hypothetical protein